MKKFTQILFASVLLLGLSLSAWSQVTLPHYEAMDYVDGQTLNVQPNWTNSNTGDSIYVTAGSLTYAGLATSTGNKVAFDGIGLDVSLLFADQVDTTVFFSFLMNVTSLGSLNAVGGYFSGVASSTTTFGASIWTRLDAGLTGYNLGINPRTTTANTVWSPVVLDVNTTVLVVIGYRVVAGTINDVVSMWINPTPGTAMPAADLTALNTGTDLTLVNRVFIRQDSATETPFIDMDELRVGVTWEDVTPAGVPTGINEVASNDSFKVYPNPNNGTFTVNSEKEITSISVYDVTGKTVYSNSNVISKEISLNVEAGVYFVKVNSEVQKITIK